MVINPELIAANEISRVFPFPSAIRVVSFSKRHVELLHHIWRKPLASQAYASPLSMLVGSDGADAITLSNSISLYKIRPRQIVWVVFYNPNKSECVPVR